MKLRRRAHSKAQRCHELLQLAVDGLCIGLACLEIQILACIDGILEALARALQEHKVAEAETNNVGSATEF